MATTARRVLVTGATSGIGAGIARAFAAAGDTVVATGATDDEVAAAQRQGGVDVRRLDVRDGDAVRALVEGLGALDVVVNCAGVIRRGAEHDPVAFAETVDINLTGTMRVCAAARAGLKERAGCIVNTASMLSFFGAGLAPGYSASKGGVAQLTKSLAIAYAADGIRVNAIAPGIVDTPMHQPENHEFLKRLHPIARLATVQEIVDATLFLVRSEFITGEVLHVDGGAQAGKW